MAFGILRQKNQIEWTGSGFKRIDMEEKKANWFITGYTITGRQSAIIGTSNGFVEHRNGNYASFLDIKDVAYQQLRSRTPALYLGTRGAKLGNTWLFGTAGGIVAYDPDQAGWYYPSSINWKLPDDYRYGGNYGVRTVHAVETDRFGRVYAGTDRGLLIYDSGGGDASSFLVTNYFEREYAFRAAERNKLQKEADLILPVLPAASDLAKKVREVRDAEKEIEQIRSKLRPGVTLVPVKMVAPSAAARLAGEASGAARPPDFVEALAASEQAQLAQALLTREKALRNLLAGIQKENPSLAQLLELKPLDLVALRTQLSGDQAVLQYLPTDKMLYIQVVTHSEVQVRAIEVRAADLKSRVLDTVKALGAGLGRGVKTRPSKLPDPSANLAWLYDTLLRPVENDLYGKKQVFIVPVGELSYLPFAALVRATEPKLEYAVERFNFGYLPSMYLFDLVMRAKHRTGTGDAVILADPDGSLPGARQEAADVAGILGGPKPFIGADATMENLRNSAARARILHLATHGHLDKPTPESSWLLLADGQHLSVLDAMMLPLDDADVVVLSACESGLSAEGMEYVTLTRAFAQAGSPAVIATIWQVDDESSRELVKRFYEHARSMDRFSALALAQRDLLRSDNPELRKAAAWAGFVPYGKP